MKWNELTDNQKESINGLMHASNKEIVRSNEVNNFIEEGIFKSIE